MIFHRQSSSFTQVTTSRGSGLEMAAISADQDHAPFRGLLRDAEAEAIEECPNASRKSNEQQEEG